MLPRVRKDGVASCRNPGEVRESRRPSCLPRAPASQGWFRESVGPPGQSLGFPRNAWTYGNGVRHGTHLPDRSCASPESWIVRHGSCSIPKKVAPFKPSCTGGTHSRISGEPAGSRHPNCRGRLDPTPPTGPGWCNIVAGDRRDHVSHRVHRPVAGARSLVPSLQVRIPPPTSVPPEALPRCGHGRFSIPRSCAAV
jgi:hypothetical protein